MMEVQKDCDQQWKLVNCLEALEQCKQEGELQLALQEDQIQVLQQEVDELQGKVCWCHKSPGVVEGLVLAEATDLTDRMDYGLEYEDEEEYLTPPTNLQTMLNIEIYQFSPPSTYATLQPTVQSELEEDHQVVWSCCCTRVVEFADDVIEIVDDERSSSSESSSKEGNLPELEDQENNFTIAMVQGNLNAIPILPPPDVLPPYCQGQLQ